MADARISAPRLSRGGGFGRAGAWRGTGWPLALCIYLVTAIGFTWPLVLHFNSGLYLSPGRPYGDYTGSIADLQAMLSPFHFPFVAGHISQFNYPDGLALNWGQNLTWLPYTILSAILGLLFGATASFELMLFVAFLGSGLAMYGLVRRIVDNPIIALLAGWAFAFYPYAVSNGEHPVYANGWPFALMLWAILAMLERPTLRRGALAGGATFLAMSWTSYYILFAGIAFAAAVLGCLLVGWRERRLRRVVVALVPACGITLAWLVFVLGLSAFDPAAGIHAANAISAVYQQSSLPINYVLAPSRNFLLGHLTGATIVARGWVGTEKTLYLGDSLLALGLVAVGAAVGGRLPGLVRRATVICALVAAGCAICSFPPTWRVFGVTIDMPSYFIFTDVTSGFRIYERFVIVIECAVCVLAAIGFWVIYEAVRRRHLQGAIILAAGITALVVCDLWAPIPDHFERLVPDPIIKVLARQPPGAWADLPLSPAATTPDFTSLWDQAFSKHPVMNGYFPGTNSETRDLALNDVATERARATLQTLGVRYLVFEKHPHFPDVNGPVPTRGVKLIAQDGFARLYRNTTPGLPVITPLSGFSYLEQSGKLPARWIIAPTAYLRVEAPCRSCAGVMVFDTSSFAQGRTVTVRNERTGAVLARKTGTILSFRFPVQFARTLNLAITASPGPQSIHATTGSPDTRSVSVEVTGPVVKLRGEKLLGDWANVGGQ